MELWWRFAANLNRARVRRRTESNEDCHRPEARRVRGPIPDRPLLVERGYQPDVRALYLGAPVPKQLGKDEVLIVMGGPMGVSDLEHPGLSFLKREVELLRSCVEQDLPVLGVCLGSQLLAHAAGALVRQMREGPARQYEVGWGAILAARRNMMVK
jgi:GMP synthase-like glutamine amidotransferase